MISSPQYLLSLDLKLPSHAGIVANVCLAINSTAIKHVGRSMESLNKGPLETT
jgi:hypothetical protein